MSSNRRSLAFVVLLYLFGTAFGFAFQQLKLPRNPATPMLLQYNRTSLSSIPGFFEFHSPPPDPWTYLGPTGRYKLSHYREPSIKLSWLATFLLTCMGDVFDATANQGFRPDEPYPDGVYNCELDYTFPSRSFGIFALEMTRVDAPNWHMTFSDVVADLEALWYAALWFETRASGVPEMDFEVFKFTQKSTSFLASRGKFAVALGGAANLSEA